MKQFSLLLIIFLSFIHNSFSQDCYKAVWAKDFGGNSDYIGIVDADRRPDGKFVICGSYSTAPLTLGTTTLPATYGYNYYLAVHDSSGNFYNAEIIGSGGTIQAIHVGSDASVYVTGYWTGSPVIGNVTLPGASRNRVFVAKFDANLQFKWVRYSDWMSADCKPFDVSSDLQGNVYICGDYEDNAFRIGDFVTQNLGGWNMWSNDAFILKFDSLGATQYLLNIGAPGDEAALTITADSTGNFYVSGTSSKNTYGWLKFGDSFGLPASTADHSTFIARYNGATGQLLWARMYGGSFALERMYVYDACLAENNNLILTGTLNGTVSVPPHTYTASDQNAFVGKFDENGDNLWLHQIGGQNTSEYGYFCFYNKGRVSASGRLFSNQPYCGNFPLYSTMSGGGFDAYNALFNTDGSLIFARGNDGGSFSDYYPAKALIDDAGNQLYWATYKATQTWYPITKINNSSFNKNVLVKFENFNPAPVFTVSAGPDKSTTCGVNVQLTASTSPSTMPWGWYPNLGFSSNGSKTPYVQPGAPSTYVFYATYQGCVLQDTVFVDVTNYNNFTIGAGLDPLLCRGDSVQLNVTSNQTGLTYSWLPTSNINTATSQNPWVKPKFPMNYVVTASLGNCKAMDTVYVDLRNKPYIYLPKQDLYYANWYRYHLCEGHELEINMGDPANTYTVLPQSQMLLSNVNNNLITLNALMPGGPLYVNAVNPAGCTASDSVNVLVHYNQPAPTILGTSPDRTACPGDSIRSILWLTNSIQYNFQFSWYGGWQIDSLNGQGWQDISYYDKVYEGTLYSVGNPTSTYYNRLDIRTVDSGMDGFRFRAYVNDYCSPRQYSNPWTLHIGPKLTTQPVASKTFCEGVSDSISVNSSSANVSYQWEILQNGTYVPVVNQPGVIGSNGRFLALYNTQVSFDSVFVRCALTGCNALAPVYSNPSLIRVVPHPAVIWQTAYDSICPGTADSLIVKPNSSLFTLNWYKDNVAITANNGQMQGYNTNKLRFTPVMANQAGVDYKLKMTNQQCGFTGWSDTTGFLVKPTPTVTWPGNMITACINGTPIGLFGGLPAGGTYSGPGVNASLFDPVIAGPGAHTLTYTVAGSSPGCNASALKSAWVQDPPVVNWGGGNMTFCINSIQYQLTGGTPAFGTYSGPGVSGTWFHPATAGPGVHTITYTYLNPSTGCSNTSTRQFTVNAANVSWPGGPMNTCQNTGPVTLSGGSPAGGTYSGTGVGSGVFNPNVSGPGTFTLTYSWFDAGLGCNGVATRSITVSAAPIVNWPGGQVSLCLDDPAVPLNGASPAGGMYTGPGVTAGTFSPSVSGPGFHTLNYTYTDPGSGCSAAASRTYFVDLCTGLTEITGAEIKLTYLDGWFDVHLPKDYPHTLQLRICNTLGQELYTGIVPGTAGIHRIDAGFIPSGPVYIQISGAETGFSKGMIILH